LNTEDIKAAGREHGAVEASDALRAIERYAGLEPARLTKIRRQNPKAGETKSERKRALKLGKLATKNLPILMQRRTEPNL
jgi:hypothetical protein